MKTTKNVNAGGMTPNHTQTGLRVNTRVKAGTVAGNHLRGVSYTQRLTLVGVLSVVCAIPTAAQSDSWFLQQQHTACSNLQLSCQNSAGPQAACLSAYFNCTQEQLSFITPRYIVKSVLYAPPGSASGKNASSVAYTTGTKLGTTFSISDTFEYGSTVSGGVKITPNGGNESVNFGTTDNQKTTTLFSTTVTNQSTNTLSGNNVDGVDHEQDQICLWVNPKMVVTSNPIRHTVSSLMALNPQINHALGVPADQYISEWVTVRNLKNPQTLPPRFSQVYGLTAADFHTILSTDPFWNGPIDPTSHPQRFIPLRHSNCSTVDYKSPDLLGDQSPVLTCTATNEIIQSFQAEEIKTEQSGINAGISIQGIEFSTSNTLKITHSTLYTTNDTNTSIASVTIWGPSSAAKDWPLLTVYQDAVFGTLLVHIANQTAQIKGQVTDFQNHAVPALPVTLKYPSGATYSVVTNTTGEYRFYAIPTGDAQLSTAAGSLSSSTLPVIVPSYGAQAVYNIVVSPGPIITRVPTSVGTYLGGPAILSVGAAGPGLSYQWMNNGTPITGATAPSLTIPSLTTNNTGAYSVAVSSGPLTVTSAPALVSIIPPPKLSAISGSVVACAGRTATFSVNATAIAPLFQWRKNGYPMGGAFASSLAISNVSATDQGYYDLMVSDTVGQTAISNAAALLVVDPAISITSQPGSATRMPGQPVTFSVVASGSNLSYQWRGNDGGNIAGATGPTYMIPSVSPGQNGSYYVVVMNGCNTVYSAAATLAVTGSNDARFVSQSLPTTMTAGNSYSVSVTMKNAGQATWSGLKGYALLSQSPAGNTTWGVSNVGLNSVAPGGQITLTFTVRAPGTPGAYHFQWQMAQGITVVDASGTASLQNLIGFGTYSTDVVVSVVPSSGKNDSTFVTQLLPAQITTVGASGTVTMTMKNVGTTTWTTADGYKLVSQRPTNFSTTWGTSQVSLPGPVPPGSQVTVAFPITSPAAAGVYDFEWVMEQNGAAFGDFSPDIKVTVQ
jgi:hypothetical protein